jgi:hypothetical protein
MITGGQIKETPVKCLPQKFLEYFYEVFCHVSVFYDRKPVNLALPADFLKKCFFIEMMVFTIKLSQILFQSSYWQKFSSKQF